MCTRWIEQPSGGSRGTGESSIRAAGSSDGVGCERSRPVSYPETVMMALMQRPIDLDYNATTLVHSSEVVRAVTFDEMNQLFRTET